jgi:hypothetical protein
VSGLVFASNVPRIVEDANKAPQHISSKDGTVQITVPGDWRPPDKPNGDISMVNQIGVVSANVTTFDPEPGSMDQHVQDMASRLAGSDKIKSFKGPFDCNAGRLPCKYYEAQMAHGETGATSLVAIVDGQHKAIRFTGVTNSPLYESHKQELLDILASLRD